MIRRTFYTPTGRRLRVIAGSQDATAERFGLAVVSPFGSFKVCRTRRGVELVKDGDNVRGLAVAVKVDHTGYALGFMVMP